MWYKKANMNNLTYIITAWLRNSRNSYDIVKINEEISNQYVGFDTLNSGLNEAIQRAANNVALEQGGNLTPTQQNLVRDLQSRASDSFQDMNSKNNMNNQNEITDLDQQETNFE
jgi:hypothetical protein